MAFDTLFFEFLDICYLKLDFETFTIIGTADTLETDGGKCSKDTFKITVEKINTYNFLLLFGILIFKLQGITYVGSVAVIKLGTYRGWQCHIYKQLVTTIFKNLTNSFIFTLGGFNTDC